MQFLNSPDFFAEAATRLVLLAPPGQRLLPLMRIARGNPPPDATARPSSSSPAGSLACVRWLCPVHTFPPPPFLTNSTFRVSSTGVSDETGDREGLPLSLRHLFFFAWLCSLSMLRRVMLKIPCFVVLAGERREPRRRALVGSRPARRVFYVCMRALHLVDLHWLPASCSCPVPRTEPAERIRCWGRSSWL